MNRKDCVKIRMREIKFTTENHLSEDQFKKLIAEKFERARLYRNAVEKREALLKGR